MGYYLMQISSPYYLLSLFGLEGHLCFLCNIFLQLLALNLQLMLHADYMFILLPKRAIE